MICLPVPSFLPLKPPWKRLWVRSGFSNPRRTSREPTMSRLLRRGRLCLEGDGVNCVHDGLQNCGRGGRTASNRVLYGNDVRNGAPAGVAFSEYTPAASAVPDSNNQFGIGYGIVGAFQGLYHIHGPRPCNQQQVGMPRTCHEFDPDSFEVVVGIVERLDLQLASITRPGIDVANTKGTAQ